MRKINRLLLNSDFSRVLNKGFKFRDESFLVAMMANEEGHLRAGISVSRKVGDAVVRVRVRRQVRAMVGQMDLIGRAIDLVIIPKPSFLKRSFSENLARLQAAIAALDRRIIS